MMHFLKLSSYLWCCFLLVSCAPKAFKPLSTSTENLAVSELQPVAATHLYRCAIDGKLLFKQYHLSGLLYIKQMEDQSLRIVFQNEMGVGFFDFSLLPNDSFVVNSVMDKLNKPALIKTLEKDFRIMLMRGLDEREAKIFREPPSAFALLHYKEAPVVYFLEQKKISAIENNNGKRKIVSISYGKPLIEKSLPEHIFIKHHKARFSIDLKAISNEPSAP